MTKIPNEVNKKPEKKICSACKGEKKIKDIFGDVVDCPYCHLTYQWNQAIDEYEKFLPWEDELRTIIVKHTSEMLDNPDKYGIYPTTKFYNNLIEAISKRIGRTHG